MKLHSFDSNQFIDSGVHTRVPQDSVICPFLLPWQTTVNCLRNSHSNSTFVFFFSLRCFEIPNFQQFTLRANMPDCMLFPKTSSNRDTKFLSRVTKNLPLSSHWQARTCTKSSWKNTSLSSMTTIRKYRQRNCSNRLKKSWETPENIPASASKIQTTRVDITNVHQISRTTAKNRGRVLLVHLQISQKRRQALQVK